MPATSAKVAKNALVFGSAGALGRTLFKTFQSKGWNVIGVDLAAAAKNPATSSFVTVSLAGPGTSANDELLRLLDDINKKAAASTTTPFHVVVNAAGGWAGGGAASKDIAAKSELMWNQSVRSSIACAHLATALGANSAKDGTFLVLMGAAVTAGPTSGMLAYGTAKAAVNHVAKSVAEELVAINPLSSAVCVSPITLDTAENRGAMPGADFSNWTPCEELSGKIFNWSSGAEAKPKNGSILKVETKSGKTTWSSLF